MCLPLIFYWIRKTNRSIDMRYNWQLILTGGADNHVDVMVIAEDLQQAVEKAYHLVSLNDKEYKYKVSYVSAYLADVPEYATPRGNLRGLWYQFQLQGKDTVINIPGTNEDDVLARMKILFPDDAYILLRAFLFRGDQVGTPETLPVYTVAGKRKGQKDFVIESIQAPSESDALIRARTIARAEEYRCMSVQFEPQEE